jgi:uncharacterized protein YceK
MRRNLSPLTLVTLVLALTGCGTVSRLTGPLKQAATTLFTSATLADLQMVGVKTGPLVPLQAATAGTSSTILGPDIQQELAGVLGQAPPLGVLLPITRVGETTPWWIFCPAGELQKLCEEIPPNARVSFTGHPLGRGAVLLPTRLTWSDQ